MDNLFDIEMESLNETIDKHEVSIVYFWSPGCGVCRYIGPIYENLAKEYPDIPFGKVNTNENIDTYSQLGITAVPTVKFYSNGMTVDTIVGCKDYIKVKQTYKDKIEELING